MDGTISVFTKPSQGEFIEPRDIIVMLGGDKFPGAIQSINWNASIDGCPMLEIKTIMQPFQLEWLQKNTKVIVEVME